MKTAISAAVIQNGKLLLVRKGETWILPGGKPNSKESDLECLSREFNEELSGTEIENIKYYNDFIGKTPHKGDILRVEVYFADVKGKVYPPRKEISEYEWVKDFAQYNLSEITSKVVDSFEQDGYL